MFLDMNNKTGLVFLLLCMVAFFESCSSLPTSSLAIRNAKDIRQKLEGFQEITEAFKQKYNTSRFLNRPKLVSELESEFVYPIPASISTKDSIESLVQNATDTHQLAYAELFKIDMFLHEIKTEEQAYELKNNNNFVGDFNTSKQRLTSARLSMHDAILDAGFFPKTVDFELPLEFMHSLLDDTSRDERYQRGYKTVKDLHNLVVKLHTVYDRLVETLES